MTTRRDPDVILAGWLDENAVPLPSETRHAIETSIRTIPQRRRPMWTPWRTLPMTTPLRLAATAFVVVILAIGAFVYFRPTAVPGVGAPSASPAASAAASGLDPSTWTETVSTEYGFTVKHPAEWSGFPEPGRTFFAGGADWGTGISVGRYPMGDAATPADWLEANCGRTFAFAAQKPDPAEGLVLVGGEVGVVADLA